MKKWNVCVALAASQTIEGVEAETEAEAIEKALEEVDASLCHHCAHEVTLGDPIPEESSAEEA